MVEHFIRESLNHDNKLEDRLDYEIEKQQQRSLSIEPTSIKLQEHIPYTLEPDIDSD